MTYEMQMRKPEDTFLPPQRIFNLSHHIGMKWEDQPFDDAVSYLYTAGKWITAQLNVIIGTSIRTPIPMDTYPAVSNQLSYLSHPLI